MDRLTAEDRIMLLGDETWPQDIGALAILEPGPLLSADGEPRLDVVKQAVAGRLHLLPRFRQLLLRPPPGLGGPLWADAADFSLADHVRVTAVPPPGDDDQLLRTVERLRRGRLDPSRPLWELWLLTGLPDDQLGLYVRIHHVIADGMAGVATLATLLDANPATPAEPPRSWTPAPSPTKRDLLTDNLRHQARRLGRTLHAITHPIRSLRRVSATWPTIRWMLTAKAGPATSLDRLVGPGRTLALIRTDLEQVRQVAHDHGATVNDALLAITAGGLRGLLRRRAEPLDGLVLPIYVPHTLRRAASDQSTGNLISQMVIPLPVGVADPGQRLRSIATETALRKAQPHPSVGSLFPSWLPDRTIMNFAAGRRVNVTTTNLPGPPTPLYFAGAQLIEIFPLLPLIGNVTLGVGAMSYTGQFNLMIVADRDTYPDLDVFTTGAEEELDDLQATSPRGVASSPYPASHIDLLDRPLPGVLTTEMADGRLQSTIVWYDRDDSSIVLSTMREFQKARNLGARPHASLLVMEPAPGARWIEIRGSVAEVHDDATQRLDALARRYTGESPYFGAVVPATLATREHPVTFCLTPATVNTGPRVLSEPRQHPSPHPVSISEPPSCDGEPALPPSHFDLLDRPLLAALATRMPEGPPQTQPVWFERDGNHILLNTTWERRKGRNLLDDPRATVLIIDPHDSSRWIEIRGDTELTSTDALAQLDRLTHRYTGAVHYYGHVYPPERQSQEHRLLVRIHPRHVNCDAIH